MKKFFGILIMIVLVLSLFGCEWKDPNPNIASSEDDYSIRFWCDKETGVEYVILNYGGRAGGITPRLNADGTLYIDDNEIVE